MYEKTEKKYSGNKGNYSGNKDKRSGNSFGDRKKSFGDGERKPYNGGDRKPYSGDRKPFGNSDRKSYSSFGDRKKSFGDGERKPYSGGDRKPYSGDRKPFGNSDRKSYSSFDNRKKPFDDGERKPYNGGDRKPYSGDRKPFGNSDRKSYSSFDNRKKSFGDNERKSYSDFGDKRKSFGDGDRKSYSSFGDRKKSFGDKGKHFDYNKGKKPYGEANIKPKEAYAEAIEKKPNDDYDNGAVPGRNAVRELLKSGKDIEKIFVRTGDREGSITVLVAEAISRGIPVIETEKAKLDTLCGYEQHQGIVAIASEKEYVEIDDILAIAKERNEIPLVIIADGISDPHNLGAIIRCAEGAGAHGIIIPKRRAAGITPAVVKSSAGAVEHLAAAKCANIADAIRKLKDKGLWIFAAEAGGESYTKADLTLPAAIVFGSEENGVSDIVRKNCDYVISIPMLGKVNSLNVSTAASVILYKAIEQRQKMIKTEE